MHGEQYLPEVRWSLQVAQDVVQEEIGIREGSVSVCLGLTLDDLAIIEDYNLVDAKYSTRACDLTSECGFLVRCVAAESVVSD